MSNSNVITIIDKLNATTFSETDVPFWGNPTKDCVVALPGAFVQDTNKTMQIGDWTLVTCPDVEALQLTLNRKLVLVDNKLTVKMPPVTIFEGQIRRGDSPNTVHLTEWSKLTDLTEADERAILGGVIDFGLLTITVTEPKPFELWTQHESTNQRYVLEFSSFTGCWHCDGIDFEYKWPAIRDELLTAIPSRITRIWAFDVLLDKYCVPNTV